MRKWLLILLFIPTIVMAQASYTVVTIPYRADNLNFFTGNGSTMFNLTLTGNVNTSGLNGGSLGMEVIFNICQDIVGGRTFNWPPNVISPPSVSSASLACTTARFVNIGNFSWQNTGATPPGASPVLPGGSPIQTQVNNNGTFGGTPCQSFANIISGPEFVDCDQRNKGPNPWFDITRFGARAFTGIPQQTTATCNGTTSVTLASAIDFIKGDGIVLHQCGPAGTLSTPSAPSAVIPKAILNGATTRSYKVIAEDNSLFLTAASPATTITTSAAILGSNTITISTFTCAPTTVCTWTTTGNHNLEVGARIQISGVTTTNGTPGFTNGLWYVQSTPSGTTFTTGIPAQAYYRLAGSQGSGTGGTVTVNAHNWIRWAGQNGVMRYWIYRQDGGAGNYNLVGVAQGTDPFYDDNGYTAPNAPPEVPLTAPASAQNAALATTIVSGAGTTNIVVADAASSSISGVTALHDDTVAFNSTVSAALAISGGTIFAPNTGPGSFIFNFPLKPPPSSNNGVILYGLSGVLSFNQPLIPASYSYFKGFGTNNSGTPSFADSNYSVIFGTSYPLVFIPDTTNITFNHVLITGGLTPQQWNVVADTASLNGGSATGINFIDSYVSTNPGSVGGIPIVLRGTGFNFLMQRLTVAAGGNSADFFDRPGIRITSSTISTPVGSPSIGDVKDVKLINGGIETDNDSVYPSATSGASSWTFNNVFTESLVQPLFDFRNISSNAFGGWEVRDLKMADQINESGGRHFDLSNPTVGTMFGLRIIRPGGSSTDGARILVPSQTLAFHLQGTTSNDLINAPGLAIVPEAIDNGTTGQLVNVISGTVLSNDTGIRLSKGAPLFVPAASPTNLAAAVAAGGSLPVGSYTYAVQPVDINNGREQIVYFPTTLTTTPGNQTVNLSWTAPSPTPQGYAVYQTSGPLRGSIGGVGLVSCTPLLATTSFSDTAATMCGPGNTIPVNDGGGPVGISSGSGVWSNQYVTTSGAFKTTASAAALTANRSVTWPDIGGDVAIIPPGTPTCSATGTGTGATCGTFQTNSDDASGAFTISTGTTPAATGTITLTFANSGGGFKYCVFEPANTGLTNWNARASFIITAAGGSNNQAAWDNNAVNLTGSTTYVAQYVCGRH